MLEALETLKIDCAKIHCPDIPVHFKGVTAKRNCTADTPVLENYRLGKTSKIALLEL